MFKAIDSVIKKAFPEIAGGLHCDRYARVLAMSDAPGQGAASERFRPRLAVDIEILTPELEPDPAFPAYAAVPLPVPLGAGQECGAFAAPEPGALVVVGFAYGRQDHPIIKQIYPLGGSLPQVAPGEFLIQKDAAVYQRADAAGNWTRTTDSAITDASVDRTVRAVDSLSEFGTETKQVSGHSKTEVGGTYTLEAGVAATLLAGARADVGSLGDVNISAGANSTQSTAGQAVETVGGNHQSMVGGGRNVNIAGARSASVGQDESLSVGGASRETVGADKTIQAANIRLNAAEGLSITGQNGEVDFLPELLCLLSDIKAALEVLAAHTHPNAGTVTQGGAVAAYAAELGAHIGKIRSISNSRE